MKMIRDKCDECGGELVIKMLEFKQCGIKLGKFPAEVCTKCGEEVINRKTSLAIEKVSKEKGLFGIAKKFEVIKLIGNKGELSRVKKGMIGLEKEGIAIEAYKNRGKKDLEFLEEWDATSKEIK